MNDKKMFLNLCLIFVSVFTVLFLKVETARLSYSSYDKDGVLYEKEKAYALESLKYSKALGVDSLIIQAENIVSLQVPKTRNLVYIDKSELAISR